VHVRREGDGEAAGAPVETILARECSRPDRAA
jgi:hypothetical protein